MSGVRSLLSLIDSLLKPQALSDQKVALNVPQSTLSLLDLAKQLTGVITLLAWGALGAYLLWRAGVALREAGLRWSARIDLPRGIGLAALIGIPGLALYLGAHAAGLALTVQPSTLGGHWWRVPVLMLSAFGNAWAEEVLVVGYLLTRLRHLGTGRWQALAGSAVLRGSYHLYQGFGGFIGNAIMGLVFGYLYQRSTRLWPLIIAHTVLDVVAFVGYALLRGHVGWLP
ncbi:CPBP family intramembrane metalloprotease [Pseudonocardiaceae bacterium YIM PH 21723]|nr:CPBP family intramembrane metalloprotease [Pseudonocardiaceae bacterium YIM PH 21723]